jgi:hypothetical protein
MKRTKQRLAVVSFAAAIVVALLLSGGLVWLLSVSQFVTHAVFPPLAAPVATRYRQFLTAVLPGFLVVLLAVAVVFKMEWRRNRTQKDVHGLE